MSVYHSPNPFDFVPFADIAPVLKFPEKWLACGPRHSGYLTVKMEALTPLHIVGEQVSHGNQIQKSLFYQRYGQPYIPGTSIRGLLRAFIEAACNCCVSQVSPFYLQEKKQHSIGFRVIKNPELSEIEKEKIDLNIPHALHVLDSKFLLPKSAEKGIDLASFLFGYIPEKNVDKNERNNRDNAWKGRVVIEDVLIGNENLSFDVENPYQIPDLNRPAFMGGPHPSASSWWYQHPYKIIKNKSIKFIGSGYRGRKFYYHQDPFKCTQSYFNNQKWNPKTTELYFIKMQCMKKGAFTESFQIFFDDIPEAFLKLLIFALELIPRIRHKLGYGKAYGYGSVKFSVIDGFFHGKVFDDPTQIPFDRLRKEIYEGLKNPDENKESGINQFLHISSLDTLAKILWYEEPLQYLFMYPYFGQGGFLPSEEKRNQLSQELNSLLTEKQRTLLLENKLEVTPEEGLRIAMGLYQIKPALHFDLYQNRSSFYDKIKEKRLFKNSLNL